MQQKKSMCSLTSRMLSIDENTHIHIVSLIIVVRDYSNRSNYNASSYVSNAPKCMQQLAAIGTKPSRYQSRNSSRAKINKRGDGLFVLST